MFVRVNRTLGAVARFGERSAGARLIVLAAILGFVLATEAAVFVDLDLNVILLDGVTPRWMDDTTYSARFSHAAFRRLKIGDDQRAVRAALDEPLLVQFWYPTLVISFRRKAGGWSFETNDPSVSPGDFAQIRNRYGEPEPEIWNYTLKGPSDTNWRVRYVTFIRGRVTEKHAEYYWD